MKGYLQVDASISDLWLGSVLPFTVRDADLAPVLHGQAGHGSVALDPGLYSVDVLSPTGVPRSIVVSIESGSTARIDLAQLEPAAALPPGSATDSDLVTNIMIGQPSDLPTANRGPRPTWPHTAPAPWEGNAQIHVVDIGFDVDDERGCVVEYRSDGAAEILPPPKKSSDSQPSEVPTVEVRWAGRPMTMSVPLNPRGKRDEERKCVLRPVNEAGATRLRMTFGPGRPVSRTVEGLMRHRTAGEAGYMFDEAAHLLLHKYSDPAGATLGALALHSMGRLGEHDSWVENLANDFPWIPDGQIVHAALLAHSNDVDVRSVGLSKLVDACQRRPMYTDGLSLGMELLRRWPDEGMEAERRKCLEGLANLAAYADWHSLNLTTYLPFMD